MPLPSARLFGRAPKPAAPVTTSATSPKAIARREASRGGNHSREVRLALEQRRCFGSRWTCSPRFARLVVRRNSEERRRGLTTRPTAIDGRWSAAPATTSPAILTSRPAATTARPRSVGADYRPINQRTSLETGAVDGASNPAAASTPPRPSTRRFSGGAHNQAENQASSISDGDINTARPRAPPPSAGGAPATRRCMELDRRWI